MTDKNDIRDASSELIDTSIRNSEDIQKLLAKGLSHTRRQILRMEEMLHELRTGAELRDILIQWMEESVDRTKSLLQDQEEQMRVFTKQVQAIQETHDALSPEPDPKH